MTESQDANRPEHHEQEAEAQQGQVSESSDLRDSGQIGDADNTDKSTGTAPDKAEEPESFEGAAE
ncbi:MAG TPA: hypothetical protein VD814_05530 [Nocardioides sp.]|nr:hypothetical protein [Nocardioides sp.]